MQRRREGVEMIWDLYHMPSGMDGIQLEYCVQVVWLFATFFGIVLGRFLQAARTSVAPIGLWHRSSIQRAVVRS